MGQCGGWAEGCWWLLFLEGGSGVDASRLPHGPRHNSRCATIPVDLWRQRLGGIL